MTYAGREAFWAHKERRYADVEIEGLGKIRLQSLTAKEHDDLEDSKGGENFVLFVDYALKCLVDEDNQPFFGDIDRESLCQLDYVLSRKIWEAILKHCAIGPYALSDEELKKS